MKKFPDGSSPSPPPHKIKNSILKQPLINNRIRAKEVRLIDEAGKQLGVMPFQDALQMAQERNLDLVQVTEKVEPPVCKITNYGKYLYWLQKKERGIKMKAGGELKGIRLGFNTSSHDLETRANLASKFLNKGNKVKVEMILRGREKGFVDLAKGKINQFLEILGKLTPIKIERDLKKEIKGFTMIISKA